MDVQGYNKALALYFLYKTQLNSIDRNFEKCASARQLLLLELIQCLEKIEECRNYILSYDFLIKHVRSPLMKRAFVSERKAMSAIFHEQAIKRNVYFSTLNVDRETACREFDASASYDRADVVANVFRSLKELSFCRKEYYSLGNSN